MPEVTKKNQTATYPKKVHVCGLIYLVVSLIKYTVWLIKTFIENINLKKSS